MLPWRSGNRPSISNIATATAGPGADGPGLDRPTDPIVWGRGHFGSETLNLTPFEYL